MTEISTDHSNWLIPVWALTIQVMAGATGLYIRGEGSKLKVLQYSELHYIEKHHLSHEINARFLELEKNRRVGLSAGGRLIRRMALELERLLNEVDYQRYLIHELKKLHSEKIDDV